MIAEAKRQSERERDILWTNLNRSEKRAAEEIKILAELTNKLLGRDSRAYIVYKIWSLKAIYSPLKLLVQLKKPSDIMNKVCFLMW